MVDQPRRDADVNLASDAHTLAHDVIEKLYVELAKFPGVATTNDHFLALAYAIRDRLLHRWVHSARAILEQRHRTVVYLSAEYLIGPQLGHNLQALGLETAVREALSSLGISLDDLVEHEEEPGLGNGGLGRLAACYMDSLATLGLPAIGHGLRYEFGIFDQDIRDGWQIERTDRWLRNGNPWEVRRYEIEHPVGFGGHTVQEHDAAGELRVRWIPDRVVMGVPYDVPVAGYGTSTTNFLRLWSAAAAEEFDLDAFQVGEYWRAVDAKIRSENLTKVLYPNDSSPAGKQLRLEQQYFFVSCALQDCFRLLKFGGGSPRDFADLVAVQLNDTHPTLAVPELMRLLMDVHKLGWDDAWAIVKKSVAYTNHTLLPEALETWPLPLVARLLPRHLEIIFEINRRFLDEVRMKFPGDDARLRRMSIIGEDGDKQVRMANLATVASHHVNGVAALHSRLLRETVLRDFAELWPERFTNVTNGVTPRRFVGLANPRLTDLIDDAIGDGWLRDLDRLRELEKLAGDRAFQDKWRAVKQANKVELAKYLKPRGLTFDPAAMFDAQCKRIHEYKRQHLNILHAITLWERIRNGIELDAPRTIVFAGKAAPAYRAAKLIIRLAHGVAEAIAADPRARERLRVVFVPDFSVKIAQRIYPAADLSEQISTAGLEASGTGNMKFTLNGALTIGTLDGANVEIREAVGAEHFFLFGLTAEEVVAAKRAGYRPGDHIARDADLARALELIADGTFSRGDRGLYAQLVDTLYQHDPFLVCADFRAYVDCQDRVAQAWRTPASWIRSSIINVARAGKFSSDRSIAEYARDVWRVTPMRQ
jgi:starch phosphorylase